MEGYHKFYRESPRGIILRIRVQPKAAKDEVCGLMGDSLKLRITAPPTKGAANAQCLKELAHWLGIKRSRLEIIRGEKEREKLVLIEKMTEQEFHQILTAKGIKSQ
jgi:hypothetical protein